MVTLMDTDKMEEQTTQGANLNVRILGNLREDMMCAIAPPDQSRTFAAGYGIVRISPLCYVPLAVYLTCTDRISVPFMFFNKCV